MNLRDPIKAAEVLTSSEAGEEKEKKMAKKLKSVTAKKVLEARETLRGEARAAKELMKEFFTLVAEREMSVEFLDDDRVVASDGDYVYEVSVRATATKLAAIKPASERDLNIRDERMAPRHPGGRRR